MGWFSRIITTQPHVLLGVICALCVATLYTSFHNRKLPDFEDPQLGFETRGTEISQRLVAWDKLMEESKPYGSLTMNPSDLISKSPAVLPITKRFVRDPSDRVVILHKNTRSKSDEDDDDIEDEETKKNCAKKKNKERWEQLKQIQFPKREETHPHDDQLKKLYRISYVNFFCDTLR